MSKLIFNSYTNLFRYEPDIRLIVFDLGLAEAEKKYLKSTFPMAELRLFDFSKDPDYFNIRARSGEYAWKPVIVGDVLNELK